MTLELAWAGPFHFLSSVGPPVLSAEVADCPGLYVWLVRTSEGPRPHYVGESGTSIARRHAEHFSAYASGVYSVPDSTAFLDGRDEPLFRGRLWRGAGWRESQQFMDRFQEYASHLAASLAAIEIHVAPLDREQRVRRRVEASLVDAIYALPEPERSMFPAGFRKWRRRVDEEAIEVVSRGQRPWSVPERLQA